MNNKQPKVSVIVPCYNVEKYLHQCLNSIVEQRLIDIEIICINDGSKDSTLDIIKEYAAKDDRFIVIDKPNSGYGHSMNCGLEKATGEYIGIVESDDWVDANMFEVLYNTAQQKNVDVVKSNFYFYWSLPKEKNIKSENIPPQDANKIINPQYEQAIFESMPCVWSAIYKTEFIRNNGIFFLETPGASYQDTSFNFKIWACAEKTFFINDAFLHYRQDNELSSINSKGKIFCVCDEYNEIESFVEKRKLHNLRKMTQRLKFSCYMWNFERLSWPLNWQFLKVASQEFFVAQKKGYIDKKYFKGSSYKKVTRMIKSPFIFLLKYKIKLIKSKLRGENNA